MTPRGKLVFAIAAIALAIGMQALLPGASQIVPVPALTPAQMAESRSRATPDDERTSQATADDELDAAPPDPGGS